MQLTMIYALRTAAVFVPLFCSVDCAAQQNNETIRPLMVEAIQNGKSKGEMGGQVREIFARMFGTDAPIVVAIERLEPIKEKPGCYRLQVTNTQSGVYEFNPKTLERSTTPSDKILQYQVDYCANGKFPEEGGGR